ncbi:hypothetical protein NN561_002080 [Cricetulus griseus]
MASLLIPPPHPPEQPASLLGRPPSPQHLDLAARPTLTREEKPALGWGPNTFPNRPASEVPGVEFRQRTGKSEGSGEESGRRAARTAQASASCRAAAAGGRRAARPGCPRCSPGCPSRRGLLRASALHLLARALCRSDLAPPSSAPVPQARFLRPSGGASQSGGRRRSACRVEARLIHAGHASRPPPRPPLTDSRASQSQSLPPSVASRLAASAPWWPLVDTQSPCLLEKVGIGADCKVNCRTRQHQGAQERSHRL